MDALLVVARVGLALVFVVAGVAKLLDLPGSRQALADFGCPRRLVALGAVLLPLAELGTAAALVLSASARWGGLAALVLLVFFVIGLSRALRLGRAPDCHCFGQLHSEPASRTTVARNVALTVPAGWVMLQGPGPALDSWVQARTGVELALVAVSGLAVALAISTASLWGETRRLRARAGPWTAPEPLPLGTPAPPFALPDAAGSAVRLESLLAAGRPCVLVFVQPGCGPCDSLMPELARWQRSLAERLTVRVLTSGDEAEQQRLAGEHGLEGVLRQPGGKVSDAYRVPATPCAVLVAADATIASAPAAGEVAIEELVRAALRGGSRPRLELEHVAPAAG